MSFAAEPHAANMDIKNDAQTSSIKYLFHNVVSGAL